MISELLNEFIYDSKEHLSTAGIQLLNLENDPNSLENLNSLMGTLHTIKGNSGFLSLNNLYELLHQAENLLQTVREKQCDCPVNIINLFLQVLDTIEALLNRLEQGEDDSLEWLATLKQALAESEEQLELEYAGASAATISSEFEDSFKFVEDEPHITTPQEGVITDECDTSPQASEPIVTVITEDLTGTLHFIDLEDGYLCENESLILPQVKAMFAAGLQGVVVDLSLLTSISGAEVQVLYSLGKVNPERVSFVLNMAEQPDLYRILQLLKMDVSWRIFTEKEEAIFHLEGILAE